MKIIHYGIHNKQNENSGDTVLFKTTQKLFEYKFKNIEWINKSLWDQVTKDDVNEINNQYDIVLIGGGGLLLKDQKGAEKSISGWQFNCSAELINEINKPIVVFGIGYNRFRNQDEFGENFYANINSLVRKSIFFGLRNTGSIKMLKTYLTEENKQKICLQCCPTVILNKVMDSQNNTENIPKVISFNLAYDRPSMRFKNEKDQLKSIKNFLIHIKSKNYKLQICLHKLIDNEIVKYFQQSELEGIEVIDLSKSSADEIISYYRGIDLAIGMRGHSQMIPFGLGKNIISLITHNKIKYFLEDNSIEEYGVDLDQENYYESLIQVFEYYESNNLTQRKTIQSKIENNYKNSMVNLEKINKAICYQT